MRKQHTLTHSVLCRKIKNKSVTPNGNTNDYSSTASLLVYLRSYGNVKIMFFLIWVRTTWTWWYSDFCTKGLRARILKRTCQVWISLIFTLTRFCYNIIYEVWTHLITRYYHKYSLISRWICLKLNFLVVPDSVSHVPSTYINKIFSSALYPLKPE